LTVEAVQALAPDEASAKAARGLLSPSKWPRLGHDDSAAWGECQGSGSKPYQTQVDLSGPVFKCSCPSRKFPCKHGLALLLLRAQDPGRFTAGEPPEWVRAWLEGRRERAEKQAQKQEQRQAVAQAGEDTVAGDGAGAAKAAADNAARQARRWQRIEAGLQELSRWLADRVRQGLAAQTAGMAGEWRAMAARMVDAQAGALSGWLMAAADDIVDAGPEGPRRLLARLGRLQLLIDAVAQREHLSEAERADVRAMLGWPLDRDEVLGGGEGVDDVWDVLGQITEEREGRLVERRVWLHGRGSGRRALLLDFSHGTAGFETSWLTGQARPGRLVFFPSAAPLRALAVQRDAAGVPSSVDGIGADGDQELDRAAAAMAVHPWLPLWPLVLSGAVLREVDGTLWAGCGGIALPLAVPTDQVTTLLAVSGGWPVRLCGEWDGRVLRLLTLQGDDDLWLLGRGEEGAR
jgi:hypothetical protein